jgi:hypothetical protein
MPPLKPTFQGVDRGHEKLKARAVNVKTSVSRDSIAFVSQGTAAVRQGGGHAEFGVITIRSNHKV